jgi:putative membrane protein
MRKLLPILTLASITTSQAQEVGWHAKSLGDALLNTALFGVVGVVMLLVGFKIFDKAVTHLDLEKEIQKGNLAAAIVGAAVLIALALILSTAMS